MQNRFKKCMAVLAQNILSSFYQTPHECKTMQIFETSIKFTKYNGTQNITMKKMSIR